MVYNTDTLPADFCGHNTPPCMTFNVAGFSFSEHPFPGLWRIARIPGLVVHRTKTGMIYHVSLTGTENIKNMVIPRKPAIRLILPVILPLIMAVIFTLISGGMQYKQK